MTAEHTQLFQQVTDLVIIGGAIVLGICIALILVLQRIQNKGFQKLAHFIVGDPSAPEPKPGDKAPASLTSQLNTSVDNLGNKIIDAFSPVVKDQQRTIDELRTDRETLKKELMDIKGQVFQISLEAETDKKDFQAQLSTLQQSLSEKNNELETKNRTIAEQGVQLQELQKKVDDLTAEVTRLKDKLAMQDKLQLERDAAVARADNAEAALKAAQKALADVTAERDALKAERDTLALRIGNQAGIIQREIVEPTLTNGAPKVEGVA